MVPSLDERYAIIMRLPLLAIISLRTMSHFQHYITYAAGQSSVERQRSQPIHRGVRAALFCRHCYSICRAIFATADAARATIPW